MKLAERMLAAYAGAEPWKIDHQNAMWIYDLEEAITAGRKVFELVFAMDASWNTLISRLPLAYDEAEARRIDDLYAQWLVRAREHLGLLREHAVGYEIMGADEFRMFVEQAESILASRDLEPEMLPAAETAKLARGNPNPARYGE